MDRPNKEVKLNKSGFTAKIITYLTRGESKIVDKKRYEGGKLSYVNDEVQITDIAPDFKAQEEDALLSVGVLSLTDKEAKAVEITTSTFDNLPAEDVESLLNELRIVQAGVEVPSKKKS